jgi:MFS family permease
LSLSKRIPDRNIWVIYVAILLLGVAYGVSIAVLAIHLDRNNIPKLAMGGLAAAFAGGIVCFSIPTGWAVPKFGAKKTLLVALVGYAACVSVFPFLSTLTTLSIARFFDGAFSVAIWVAAETALLSRSSATNKAFVMSLYAMSLAVGYVMGPILATVVVKVATTSGSFVVAGILALIAMAVVLTQFESKRDSEQHEEKPIDDGAPPMRPLAIMFKTKTSCLGTFSYGYFQASVVLFLPLFLIKEKSIPESRTILITAFFAAGMLISSTIVSRLGDRHGHLLVMRALAGIGGLMVASFVLLSSFPMMCAAVFIAGATLASISPVSLALQGVIIPAKELGRANAFYNACYAAGMLLGPPISSVFFTKWGGGPMLIHLSLIWAVFVTFTLIFASDDPARARRRAGLPA